MNARTIYSVMPEDSVIGGVAYYRRQIDALMTAREISHEGQTATVTKHVVTKLRGTKLFEALLNRVCWSDTSEVIAVYEAKKVKL